MTPAADSKHKHPCPTPSGADVPATAAARKKSILREFAKEDVAEPREERLNKIKSPLGGIGMITSTLPIYRLCDRHPGVTAGPSESYFEAARVCFDRHHISPIDLSIERHRDTIQVVAEWAASDERTKGAWANEIDATEAGAYGVALAAVEVTQGLVAVRRAETRTGADYYLGPAGCSAEDLEACYKLEVSGVDKGKLSSVRGRLRQKIDQAACGASSLPAIAAVVGFSAKLILTADVEAE